MSMKSKDCNRWHGNTRHRIIRWFEPKLFFWPPKVSRIKKSVNISICHAKSSASGGNVFSNSAWPVCKIVQGRVDPAIFPPEIVVEINALACELPSQRNLPFSRFSHAEIAREAVRAGILPPSAAPRFGVGSALTLSNPGLTGVGFFLVIRILHKRLLVSLTFTKAFGKASGWPPMIM